MISIVIVIIIVFSLSISFFSYYFVLSAMSPTVDGNGKESYFCCCCYLTWLDFVVEKMIIGYRGWNNYNNKMVLSCVSRFGQRIV